MAFGDGSDDEVLRAGWQQFCRKLAEAGESVFKGTNPATSLHRADAFRFLTQNLGQAYDLALETKDTRYPVIHTFCTPFCKLGGDNADFVYQQAWIDGNSVYRISGNRGTCRFLNFAVQGPRPTSKPGQPDWRNLHEPFGDTPETNLFGHDLAANWDGSFELFIGGEKRGCNWLPTTPGTRKLFIRQGFDDWSELSAQFRIERIGTTEPRPLPTPDDIITAMNWAGNFLSDMMRDYPDWAYEFAEDVHPEELNRFVATRRDLKDPVYNVEKDRKRGRAPTTMCWKLAPDEALIVAWEANDIFWMMTNMGVFMNSMDYLYRPVSYSPARTKVDSDGIIRMILAPTDPGFHNWIDTQGFERGHLCNRNMLTDRTTEFQTKVVKRSELRQHLPADTACITPAERSQQMQQRFHSILQRYRL